jgi:hypothetical protein
MWGEPFACLVGDPFSLVITPVQRMSGLLAVSLPLQAIPPMNVYPTPWSLAWPICIGRETASLRTWAAWLSGLSTGEIAYLPPPVS